MGDLSRTGQASRGVEHRGDHGDTDDHAELMQRVQRARGLSEQPWGGRIQPSGGDAGQRHRYADSREDERRHVVSVAARSTGQRDDPGEARGLHHQARDDECAGAELVGERAGDRCHDQWCRRPRQEAQAGRQRGVAEGELEELAGEKRGREDRRAHEELSAASGGEGGAAEQAERDHRRGSPHLAKQETGEEAETEDQPGDVLRRSPAALAAFPRLGPRR
jgi:hypothetical protein